MIVPAWPARIWLEIKILRLLDGVGLPELAERWAIWCGLKARLIAALERDGIPVKVRRVDR